MTKNKQSTRYYSNAQENEVARIVHGQRQANSGAGKFVAGDVLARASSMLVECKCTMTDKSSFTIKKEWFDKNKAESFSQRTDNHAIAFNFGPEQDSYYIIDKTLMHFLIDKLEEEYAK